MWQTPSYQRAVQALTVGQVGEQSVVVIASGDESVRMWDPLTGDVIGEPYVADVTSVATGQIDRRNVAALACSDGAVRLLWRGAIPAGATTFRGTARFDRTTFEGETSFAGCYFADAASFTGTRFKHGVSFDRAAFRGQQISFATAAFEGRASFEAAEFYEGGDFTRASFADARLSGTRERFLRLVSFADCDMQNVALQHVDLRECRFGGATSLDRLQMSGWIAFAGVRETLADETAWRNAVSLPRRLLLQVIRSRRKKPWRTRPYSRKDRLQDEETREQEEVADLFRGPRVARRARLEADRQEARQIAGLYRELRKSREEARNEPGAADFYYGEMEMRRYSDHLGPGLLVSLYWAVSGYGLRPIRSLFWLGILTLGSAYAFLQWGLKTDLSFVDAWLRTLSITVNLQTFEHADLTQPGQALQILIRVLGPLLYGLTVLAIRGRVKR